MKCIEELTGNVDTSITKSLEEVSKGYTPLIENDLIYAKITPCMENGKAAIATGLKNNLGFASTEFHVIRFKKNAYNKFFFFYLIQKRIREHAAMNMTGSAGQKRVPATFLKNLLVPLPPLETQQKIVSILEKAEETRKLRAQADELTQKLLQSVFLEMFGDPVKNSREWKLHKLGEIGNWTSGGTPSRSKPEYFHGEIPWFTAGELNDSYVYGSKEKITKEALNSSSAKLFPAGTMLIGMYDTAAFKMGILKNPASSNQACAAFSPKVEVINTLFALYLFKEMKDSFGMKVLPDTFIFWACYSKNIMCVFISAERD